MLKFKSSIVLLVFIVILKITYVVALSCKDENFKLIYSNLIDDEGINWIENCCELQNIKCNDNNEIVSIALNENQISEDEIQLIKEFNPDLEIDITYVNTLEKRKKKKFKVGSGNDDDEDDDDDDDDEDDSAFAVFPKYIYAMIAFISFISLLN